MIKATLIILFVQSLQISIFAQFNNVYLNDGEYFGTAAGIKESGSTQQYFIPLGYTNSNNDSNFGFLKISETGALNEIKQFVNISNNVLYTWSRGFFRTSDDGFIFSGSYNGSFIYKLDSNLDSAWVIRNSSEATLSSWGGGELSNSNLLLSYTGGEIPLNVLKVRRYSNSGDFLSSFDITLDYDFSYPSSFILKDSLVYISFPRLLNNNYRRNYVVCYNAITGEEIWESHQIENETALGYTDGFLCLNEQAQLRLIYVEQTELVFPNIFDTYAGILKIINVNLETGDLEEGYSLSDVENSIYVVDATATDDGGLAALFFSPYPNQEFPYSYAIMKISPEMEVEWSVNYESPTYESNINDSSFLVDIEATNDDCLIAAGEASGLNMLNNNYYRYPWVLKVDACGNEMVSDCALSGVGDLASNNTIAIYPNPTRDRIYLKGKDPIKHVSIFDLQGKMVHDESFSGSLEQTLFIDHLQPGLYLVQATNQSGAISTNKISVKR